MTDMDTVTGRTDHYFCGETRSNGLCGSFFKESDPILAPDAPRENRMCPTCEHMRDLEYKYLGGKCSYCGKLGCDE